MDSKYDIAKEFSAGYAAAILPSPRDGSRSQHWLAGWDAGYAEKSVKNRKLNQYIVSIGHEPFGIITLCRSAGDAK